MARALFDIRITRRAHKDIDTLTPKLKAKLRDVLLHWIALRPFNGKRLVGDLKGYWSVRLTFRDRIVCRVDLEKRVVYILRCRTHYGK